MKEKITITIEFEDGVMTCAEHDREVTIMSGEETGDRKYGRFSRYARIFDETCMGWSNDFETNLIYLRSQESFCNSLLRSRGHLFLNEVYDLLGMSRTREGAVIGWTYGKNNPNSDGYVDFEIKEEIFMKNAKESVSLVIVDFNVEGIILKCI